MMKRFIVTESEVHKFALFNHPLRLCNIHSLMFQPHVLQLMFAVHLQRSR
jgi:hypothetical protein